MTPEEKHLIERLVAARMAKGLSQGAVAEWIGVSRSALREWESCEREGPSFRFLIPWARALGFDVALPTRKGLDGVMPPPAQPGRGPCELCGRSIVLNSNGRPRRHNCRSGSNGG